MEIFKDELAALINKYGIDADANTPDFLLAEIAVDAIASVVGLVKTRDEYKEKPEKPEKPGIPKEVLRVATAIAKATGGTCTVEIVEVPIKPPTEKKPKRKNRKKKNHGKETKV